MTLTVALVLIFALVGILSIAGLYRVHMDRIKELEERIKKLENSAYRRMNQVSLEEVEHAMAEIIALKNDLEIKTNIVDNVMEHLSKAHTPDKKK